MNGNTTEGKNEMKNGKTFRIVNQDGLFIVLLIQVYNNEEQVMQTKYFRTAKKANQVAENWIR